MAWDRKWVLWLLVERTARGRGCGEAGSPVVGVGVGGPARRQRCQFADGGDVEASGEAYSQPVASVAGWLALPFGDRNIEEELAWFAQQGGDRERKKKY